MKKTYFSVSPLTTYPTKRGGFFSINDFSLTPTICGAGRGDGEHAVWAKKVGGPLWFAVREKPGQTAALQLTQAHFKQKLDYLWAKLP